MQARVGLIGVLALITGLGGGAATTYVWMTRPHAGHEDTGGACCERTASTEHKAGDHGEREVSTVKLSEDAKRQFGVEVAQAAGGRIERTLRCPAEIVLNADKAGHIVPRAGGIVREVRKTVGDKVASGEVLAVLDSRELAEAKAADLSAEARLTLAESIFKRLEGLQATKLVSEQNYIEAKQKLEEARIQHRETEAKLHALGLPHEQVASLPGEKISDFSRYEIRAPFAGTIVEKRIALGEVHDSSSDVFLIADLETVWVDVTIYPQDAASVQVGQEVRLTTTGPDGRPMSVSGKVSYVSPIIREATRTGLARVVIANEGDRWKPGMFVTAQIVLSREDVAILVPNEAIQALENRPAVFVAEKEGFEKRPVVVGRNNSVCSEVLSGLKAGEPYVTKGAFILKAELAKGAGGHEH